MPTEPAETVALFRYHVIADALAPGLSPAERGQWVRDLAALSHVAPDGAARVYSRATLDRWIGAYREQGLDGLRPQPRADLGVVRRHPELLEEAAHLRQEIPARSGAQISAILQARHGVRVAERTVREHLQRRGLQRAVLAGASKVYGRFEADRPNELWIGDVLVDPLCRILAWSAASGPISSCWWTTTPGSCSTHGGSRSRPPGPARRCCGPPSSGADCPKSCTSTTAPRT